MEQIEIKGFLTIEHAVFEIKKINILIGEQAQGKSVIAKLVYFFKSHFTEIFVESIRNFETEQQIEEKCLSKFRKIFPSYTWEQDDFSISYKNNDYDLSVANVEIDGRNVLSFNLSHALVEFQTAFYADYKQALKAPDMMTIASGGFFAARSSRDVFYDTWRRRTSFTNFQEGSVFIPAGRSFFAMLQNNIFSFLSKDIDIDPFIEEFGRLYERAKRLKHVIGTAEYYESPHISIGIQKEMAHLCADITKGIYVSASNQDWIENEERRINLANSSSGQQESLPMLLTLQVFASFQAGESPTRFFIEEPEAHLFPHSQKQVVSLIATIYKELGHSFFITTHSPYILTAINNLVVGQDAYDKIKNNPEKLAALEKVLPASQLIRLEDVSAYTLKNGKLESIIDWENRLIGANLLDAVSDEFEQAFNVASDMLYGDE
ncbi:MAG: AAA family ATPase [Gallionella sp.]|nr:AAA family ATPase [Gallionella sp.]